MVPMSELFVHEIGGKPVVNNTCSEPVRLNSHGYLDVSVSYLGNIANFWVALRIGDAVNKTIVALGSGNHRFNEESHAAFSVAPPKDLTYQGPACLEFYFDPKSEIYFPTDAKPDLVVEIADLALE